jgi:hypothetical protein
VRPLAGSTTWSSAASTSLRMSVMGAAYSLRPGQIPEKLS